MDRPEACSAVGTYVDTERSNHPAGLSERYTRKGSSCTPGCGGPSTCNLLSQGDSKMAPAMYHQSDACSMSVRARRKGLVGKRS